MLTFNLKKEWFEKIASGEKRIEYREVKPYWDSRIRNETFLREDWKTGYSEKNNNVGAFMNSIYYCKPLPCVFVLGYTKEKLPATISKIEIVDGKDTDLKIDKPVYAIHFELVKEVQK